VRLATRLDNLLGTAVLVMHWEPILIYGGAIPLPRSNTTSNRYREPDQSGPYVLAMPALQGGFPWAVYNSSVIR